MSLITIRTPGGHETTVFVPSGEEDSMPVGGEGALTLQAEADKLANSEPGHQPGSEQDIGNLALGKNVQVLARYGTLEAYDQRHTQKAA